MVVDAVLRQWVAMVESMEYAVDPGADDTEVFGWYIQHLSAYLCDDDGFLASTCVEHLQRAFETLTELFDHVVLCTNVAKEFRQGFKGSLKVCHTS